MKSLLGPELLWLCFFGIILLVIKMSGAPVKSMDDHLLKLAWIVPICCVSLSFALFFVSGIEHNWLLTRIWIATVIGGHYVLDRGLKAHAEQGPGVGTTYIAGMIFIFVLLIAGSIFIKIKFR